MDKDEMKNRISMALKDPILQQGFEIICKENAELKSGCGMCYRKDKEQLTKAKGIIEELMDSMGMPINNYETEKQRDICRKAKLFLKEVNK